MGVAARAGSRGPALRGCDRPRVLLDADTMLLKILPKLSEAAASRKQEPRAAGMRSPVHVVSVRLLPGEINLLGHNLQEANHGH
jgi:hypothetical protein